MVTLLTVIQHLSSQLISLQLLACEFRKSVRESFRNRALFVPICTTYFSLFLNFFNWPTGQLQLRQFCPYYWFCEDRLTILKLFSWKPLTKLFQVCFSTFCFLNMSCYRKITFYHVD